MLNLPRLLCVLSLIFLVSCDEANAKNVWRYKVTVEIETPEGLKTGSAVRQLSKGRTGITFQESGSPAKISGEAVVVDLGERGVVFALLSDQSWKNSLVQAFGHKVKFETGMKAEHKENIPSFVTFPDLNDPMTVKLVYENKKYADRTEKKANNFEEIFEVGVSLKRITVEITEQPVTEIIYNYLPWLRSLKSNIDGTKVTRSNDLHNILHVGNFRKGFK